VITISIPGEPVAKGRGRAVRRGKGIAVITPEKTRRWEDAARRVARHEMGSREPEKGPVHVHIVASFLPPASWPAWKREAALAGRIAHTGRPDCDNIAKAACDALNGVAWMDDSQAVRVLVHKRYAEAAGVNIMVQEIELVPSSITRKDQLGEF